MIWRDRLQRLSWVRWFRRYRVGGWIGSRKGEADGSGVGGNPVKFKSNIVTQIAGLTNGWRLVKRSASLK
jgi:hypothetical protein